MKGARLIILVSVALLTVGVLGAFLVRGALSGFVFRRAAETAVGADIRSELEDGLHIFLCGTGSPMPDPSRAGPCVGVLAGDEAFLFDAGAAGARRLARMQFPLGALERVYLTHLHSDHFDGLGEVMLQAWVGGGRRQPLPVTGPEGVDQVVGGFVSAYSIDSRYRIAHHGPEVAPPSGYGAVGDAIPSQPGPEGETTVVLQRGNLTITAFRVQHAPVEPAYGYRIDYRGRSAVISGDTVRSDTLIRSAQKADVLLHEALSPEMVATMADTASRKQRPELARVLEDIIGYHASPGDAARSAEAAGVRMLVLYHLVPPLPSALLEPAFLGGSRRMFSGPLVIGRDGLLISLPAGSDRIIRRVLQ